MAAKAEANSLSPEVASCPACHWSCPRDRAKKRPTRGAAAAAGGGGGGGRQRSHLDEHPGMVFGCPECRATALAVVEAQDADISVAAGGGGGGRHPGLQHVCAKCGLEFNDPGHGLHLSQLHMRACGIGQKGLQRMLLLPPNLPSLRTFEFDTD